MSDYFLTHATQTDTRGRRHPGIPVGLEVAATLNSTTLAEIKNKTKKQFWLPSSCPPPPTVASAQLEMSGRAEGWGCDVCFQRSNWGTAAFRGHYHLKQPNVNAALRGQKLICGSINPFINIPNPLPERLNRQRAVAKNSMNRQRPPALLSKRDLFFTFSPFSFNTTTRRRRRPTEDLLEAEREGEREASTETL